MSSIVGDRYRRIGAKYWLYVQSILMKPAFSSKVSTKIYDTTLGRFPEYINL
jgi:hypothetical protein